MDRKDQIFSLLAIISERSNFLLHISIFKIESNYSQNLKINLENFEFCSLGVVIDNKKNLKNSLQSMHFVVVNKMNSKIMKFGYNYSQS